MLLLALVGNNFPAPLSTVSITFIRRDPLFLQRRDATLETPTGSWHCSSVRTPTPRLLSCRGALMLFQCSSCLRDQHDTAPVPPPPHPPPSISSFPSRAPDPLSLLLITINNNQLSVVTTILHLLLHCSRRASFSSRLRISNAHEERVKRKRVRHPTQHARAPRRRERERRVSPLRLFATRYDTPCTLAIGGISSIEHSYTHTRAHASLAEARFSISPQLGSARHRRDDDDGLLSAGASSSVGGRNTSNWARDAFPPNQSPDQCTTTRSTPAPTRSSLARRACRHRGSPADRPLAHQRPEVPEWV